MAEDSNIEWTTHTFNPWRGCSKVSPGCAHCYAETMSGRNPKTLGVWGPNGTRVVAAEAQWKLPLKWDRAAKEADERHRVFCASLADVFEGNDTMPAGSIVSVNDARRRLFEVIDRTRNLYWLLLTKRPENVTAKIAQSTGRHADAWLADCSNVWIGTSVENQAAADERIPHLLQIPAAVRFLSVEPLLGPVDLEDYLHPDVEMLHDFSGVSWVIIGGESGPGARPCRVEWIRDLVQQCKTADVPVFVKQLGANVLAGNPCDPIDQFPNGAVPRFSQGPDQSTAMIHLIDRKGGDMGEWPEDLRVREFPTTQRID